MPTRQIWVCHFLGDFQNDKGFSFGFPFKPTQAGPPEKLRRQIAESSSDRPRIFLEIDEDHSGELDFEEFEKALHIPKVKQRGRKRRNPISQLAVCWVLVVGCWLLGVGCWVLVVGCWLVGVGWLVGGWLVGVGIANMYQLSQRCFSLESGSFLYSTMSWVVGALWRTGSTLRVRRRVLHRQMLDVLGVQANELEAVWYVLDDGDNHLTIKAPRGVTQGQSGLHMDMAGLGPSLLES